MWLAVLASPDSWYLNDLRFSRTTTRPYDQHLPF